MGTSIILCTPSANFPRGKFFKVMQDSVEEKSIANTQRSKLLHNSAENLILLHGWVACGNYTEMCVGTTLA